MEKKYELIESELVTPSRKPLFQVKALKDFGSGWVLIKKGNLGGFIESESNLSQDGNCWIYGNGQVFGNGLVSGDGRVYDNGKVFGNGEVFGDGKVFGYGVVIDNDWTSNSFYITGSKDTISLSSYTTLTIGCLTKTFKQWEKTFENVGKKNEYTTEQIKEYGELIKVVIAQAPNVIERNRAKV